jgi:nitrite reductase/ring-hydroxylating ferredoxin subunit
MNAPSSVDEIVLDASEVPDGGAKVVAVHDRLKIAIFRVGDRVAAIDNRCPHAGGSLGEGAFDGTIVKCPLHGFRVDVWRGVGNAGKRVQVFPASIVDGNIRVVLAVP